MPPLVVWRFSDGKVGHDNQSLGLLTALTRLRPVQAHMLASPSLGTALRGSLGRLSTWQTLPPPDLLLGAGHRTHPGLLAARQGYGGRAVVLMRPSLPLALFDLCLIPEHDRPPARTNVLTTRGALNRLEPSTTLEPARGLMLIGGPSAHFGWDEAALYAQIAAIVAADPAMNWILTTSRRTPASFLENGRLPTDPRLSVVPVAQTDPDWLPAQLARAGQVWVSADSVSMVYEALTAGAAVGVLDVPLKRPNRIGQGLERLAAQGWVTFFEDWQRTSQLSRPVGAFDEADRCAHRIVEQWFA